MDAERTLLLPGSGGRRGFWTPVAARLAGKMAPVFFAWHGFGDEPADPHIRSLDDLFDWFVARAPAGPANVVAQSMGGVLAMRLAIEHPGRVRRLVLVTTSGGSRRRFGIDWRPGFRAQHTHVPDWFERDRTDLEDRLDEVRAPTLLVFGDADPIAPVAFGEHLRSRLGDAKLTVIAGGSHALAQERADELARAIDEHLARETTIFHLVDPAEWDRAGGAGKYAPASLAGEGFIHFSKGDQLLRTADRFFAGREDVLVVAVRREAIGAPVRFEIADGERFPHVYGALNLDAVAEVVPLGLWRARPSAGLD
jgi:poly(3-hydroxyoctanoate) depolymerase